MAEPSSFVEHKKTNLLELDLEGLIEFFVGLGEKPFRARQVFRWIHHRGAKEFSQMTDLSKSFREHLEMTCCIYPPAVCQEKRSSDGTVKWLMQVGNGNSVETVFIPEGTRGTLCISSQVGCALNCSFCSTGAQGFNRNLSVSEIIGQLWQANHRLAILDPSGQSRVTNVVMMGMGEPLLNYEAVVKALSIMRHDLAYALPRRRVTLSTSGMVPYIDRLSEEADVSLAVSLHAPNDQLRTQLIPLNKKYRIAQLMAACHRFVLARRNRHVTIEYVMLKGVNDHRSHAKELAMLLEGLSCKVNLIPFNPFPGAPYERSEDKVIDEFQKILMRSGLVTTVRRTRGDDIDAACGQLKGQFNDRTRRKENFLQSVKKRGQIIPMAVESLG